VATIRESSSPRGRLQHRIGFKSSPSSSLRPKNIWSRFAACVRAPSAPQAARAHRRAKGRGEECSATQKGELLATLRHTRQPHRPRDRKTIRSASRNILREGECLRCSAASKGGSSPCSPCPALKQRSQGHFKASAVSAAQACAWPSSASWPRGGVGTKGVPPARPSGGFASPAARRTKGWTRRIKGELMPVI